MSVFGVATSIDAFDEKYLFAGCRFLVYLVSTIPNLLIIVLVLILIGYLPFRAVPTSLRSRVKEAIMKWAEDPFRLALAGIVFAVLFIQFVLRMCFVFVNNALLAKSLPDLWITRVLLSGEGRLALYFSGLVTGTLITGGMLFFVQRREEAHTGPGRALVWLLGFLFAVEVLFLPVNYGVLISSQSLPRVAEISAETAPSDGSMSWLLWDSKDAMTYLVRDSADQRMLVTVPAKDARIRIMGYDNILCVLFCGTQNETHSPREASK
ncbi:MAG TPA: hypothetical protein VGR47_04445 [Terracidiphilus sp.]|nr:hypothetical protein [Terracidiphilus sp.]